jgi:MFS family permease
MEHHGQLTSGMPLTSQPKVQQLISSFMLLGSLVGSFLSGPIGQKFGRRAGLLTAIVTSFIAISVMIGTTSVGALYFARILLGISNGI